MEKKVLYNLTQKGQTIKIIIPGPPVPQNGSKHRVVNGFAMSYDPRAKEKNRIRALISEMKIKEKFEFPRLSFIFHMPIPSSIPKYMRPIYESGRLKHVKKPDVDNLIKLLQDCLETEILQQDSKVSIGSAIKIYHPEPKSIVWINETKQLLNPWELDQAFLPFEECDLPTFSNTSYPLGSYDLANQVRRLSSDNCIPDYEEFSLLK